MAKNLRARIPEGDRLVIYDRNEDTTSRFLHEISHSNPDRETFQRGTVTEVASQARKVVEKSVSLPFHGPLSFSISHDEYVLSMI